MKYDEKYGKQLELLLINISKNPKLLHEFLVDLLSPAEYKELAVRIQIIIMLNNKIPQRAISKALSVGVSTITRGARELNNTKGGFAQVINKKILK